MRPLPCIFSEKAAALLNYLSTYNIVGDFMIIDNFLILHRLQELIQQTGPTNFVLFCFGILIFVCLSVCLFLVFVCRRQSFQVPSKNPLSLIYKKCIILYIN